MLVAGVVDSLAVFLAATVLAGVGYGRFVYGGLGLVTGTTRPGTRAGTFSAMYLAAYLAQGSTAVLMGALATATTLEPAVLIAVPVIVARCLGTTALTFATRNR